MSVEPWGFTYFELVTMCREAMTVNWDHTAAITCMIANVNRPKGKSPLKPQTLNPMRQDGDGRHKLTKENISILKGMAGKVE